MQHPVMARGAWLVLAIVSMTVVASCGSDDSTLGALDRPTATVSDPGAVAPPFILSVTSDGASADIPPDDLAKILVGNTHLVVSGVVVEVLPARWTATDGQRPVDPSAAHETGEANIVTPIVIRVDGPPLINRLPSDSPIGITGSEITLATLGGRVGLDSMTVDGAREYFTVGENVLIGLTSVDFDGPDMLLRTERGLAWNVSFKDTITAEGQALPAGGTPDRAKPLAVVIARLHTAAAQLPPIDATPVVIPTPIEGVSTATPSIDATVADEARPPQ